MGIEMTRKKIVSLTGSLNDEGVPTRVSLEEIACRYEVKVITEDLPNSIAGYAVAGPNNRFVVIGSAFSAKEREWTLAHELAHIPFRIEDDKLADSFAAELLFKKWVDEFHKVLKTSPQRSLELITLLNLSNAALEFFRFDSHLIDEKKRREARLIVSGIAIACGIALIGMALIFGIPKLVNYYQARRKEIDEYHQLRREESAQ